MKLSYALATIAFAIATGAPAQTGSTDPAAQRAGSAPASMTVGEVRKIDKAQGKLTLRHGPITNLGMPGMTMVFHVADPKLLDGLKEGDKVRFEADKINGTYTVMAIETLK
jgi:Cu(I)/Ag(I) efflux system protein CusF